MRPIDADELIYEIVNTPLAEGFPYDKEWFDRLQSNIHKIIDMVENAPTVNEWISVEERTPEDVRDYLVVTDEGTIYVAVFTGARWYISYNGNYVRDGEVTHWMPLPEPPEVEE